MSAPVDRTLLRGTEIGGLPLVCSTTGEALADIRDVLYSPEAGTLVGFTLNKRGGLFAGPLKGALPIVVVHAIGPDAVIVERPDVLDTLPAQDDASSTAATARNVLGDEVLTDGGDRLGVVTDLIVEVGVVSGAPPLPGVAPSGEVVGYQVAPDAEASGRGRRKDVAQLLVPLPHTLAVSATTLLVPASVGPFVRDDLAGFGGAVDEFRALLAKTASR